MFLHRILGMLASPVGVTLPEDVARREAKIAATLVPTQEDIEGLVRKATLLEGELAKVRRAREVPEVKICSLFDVVADGAR
jgi:hypothetical protein